MGREDDEAHPTGGHRTGQSWALIGGKSLISNGLLGLLMLCKSLILVGFMVNIVPSY